MPVFMLGAMVVQAMELKKIKYMSRLLLSIDRRETTVAATETVYKREMFQLARNAVNFIFAGNKVKQELEQVFDLAAKSQDF
ncbi:hypothetical protein RND71_035192 [Anisodus tanguticus]|uniref:Uncharacterized protein n=1 Tax=Anisodus tanguticus TaxID=243964 RepID=A0AAE1R4I7_9SOLA|nr:hypothetical protein RND71_035192 [Anisodus tanguticus]